MNRSALTLTLASLLAISCRSSAPVTSPKGGAADDGGDSATSKTPSDQPEGTPVTQTAKPQNLQFPDEPFRAQQPGPGPQRPFNLPKIKPFMLASGIKVYLVEQHTLPIVSLDLTFDGGSISDPRGKEGLASVCMSMMTEGTEALDKIAYAEALADVAASIDAYASSDTQGLSLSTLTKHFDTVFPLYIDTLLRPGFRAEDLDRMIKRRLDALRQIKGSAPSIAGRINGPILYGEGHPFGRLTTEASLAAIKRDDCRAYRDAWLKPGGANLFVVGDMTEAQIRSHFEGNALATWKGKVPKLPALPKPAQMRGRIFFVNVPGAKQSEIAVMHFGPKRTAKDYFATWMMSSILGGGFTSRVNMNLREDKGYSYGARAGFSYSRFYGVFSGASSVVTESTYQTLLEVAKEINLLQSGKQPASVDELSREKTGAVLALPGRFATASASLSTFRSLVYYGLPLDYYASFVNQLEGVKDSEVAAAAKQYLKPKEAVYVVVGDGAAPVIQRVDGKDQPLTKDGQQLTVLQALQQLATSGALGTGALVEIDADAKPAAK